MRRFPFQFLLTDRDVPVEPDWLSQQAGAWKLHTDPRLPVVTVRVRDGGRLGWLVGFPIGTIAPMPQESPGILPENVEEWLYRFGGRFILILMSPEPRVYLDPLGLYSVVYSQSQHVVASSIGLVSGNDPDLELIETFDIPNQDHWYPFGLTHRFDVCRLVPNHYLDLQDWKAHRHWPRKGEFTEALGNKEIFSRIGDLVERQIGLAIAASPSNLMLTAGQDSRVLLGCARPFVQRIKLVTVDVGDAGADLDCRIAARLAQALGLPHEVVKRRLPTEEQLTEWLFNTGHCVAGRAWKNIATRSRLDADTHCLYGLGGEVGRGYWWQSGDGAYGILQPEELLKRMALPSTSRVLQAARDWISKVPATSDTRSLLELAYIEQRMGCWAGPQQFGYTGNAPNVMPFCHRDIVRLMLSLSVEARAQSRLSKEVILKKWPELLALPFNEEIGIARHIQWTRRQFIRVRDGLKRRIVRWQGERSQ